MDLKPIKDGEYWIYRGVRIFKTKGGFSYTYTQTLSSGVIRSDKTWARPLKDIVVDIDDTFNQNPQSIVENYRLVIIKKAVA